MNEVERIAIEKRRDLRAEMGKLKAVEVTRCEALSSCGLRQQHPVTFRRQLGGDVTLISHSSH